jgi:hypothetical protein
MQDKVFENDKNFSYYNTPSDFMEKKNNNFKIKVKKNNAI